MASSLLISTGIHLPDTPPYVVLFPVPMPGQGLPSAFRPISPDTVLVAVTPSAPPMAKQTEIIYIIITVYILINNIIKIIKHYNMFCPWKLKDFIQLLQKLPIHSVQKDREHQSHVAVNVSLIVLISTASYPRELPWQCPRCWWRWGWVWRRRESSQPDGPSGRCSLPCLDPAENQGHQVTSHTGSLMWGVCIWMLWADIICLHLCSVCVYEWG